MAVILTVAVSSDPYTQKDGRRYVREVHSDGIGAVASFEYLAAVGADTAGIAAARMAALPVQLGDQEALAILGIDAAPVFRFQTGAEFLQRLRAVYKGSSQTQCANIARWLAHRIDAGDVTAAQLRTVFGLTAPQWTALETKMRALVTNADAVIVAAGE